MITRVELKWWKSHEHSIFEFSRGTNVLVGINGSGKTSVMQAISFALFGEIPELRSRRIKIDDLVMRKPRRMERATVVVDFDVNGELYRVERTIGRLGTDARLFKEGRIIEMGSRRVTEKISEILGIDYDTFMQIIYARQNELDLFLRLDKGGRVSLIDRILKIDRISEAKEKLRAFKRGIEHELQDLRVRAREDVESLKKEIEKLEKEIKVLESEIERLEGVKKELEKRKEELEIRENELEEKRKEIDELKRKEREIEGKIEILKERMKKLPEIENAEKKLERAEEELEKFRKELMEVKRKMGEIEGERKQLLKLLDKIKASEEIARKEVKDYREEIERKRAEISRINAQIELHATSIQQLEMAEAKCPVCGSPLVNKQKHIEKHRAEIEKLKKKLRNVEEEFRKLAMLQEEAEKIKVEIEKAREKAGEREKIEKRLKELASLDYSGRVEDLQREIERVEREVEELKKAVEREEIRKRILEHSSQLEFVKSKIGGIRYDEGEHRAVKEKLRETLSQLSTVKAKLSELPLRMGDKKRLVEEKRRRVEEVEKARKELEIKERALEKLKILLNALDDVQIIVRKEFVEVINAVLADIWQRLYPYGDYSAARIEIVGNGAKAGDYVLQLRERRGWVNVDGIASGGERTLAALALRIAFARALANLGILLLDEPTHNLDRNGIEKLVEVLSEGIPEVLDQVLLITHDEEMEKAATGIAYRLYRNKETDEPTRVERI